MRSGFVAIIGAPNVGKSTITNYFVGEKINIVSPKPQTTRDRIKAIAHWPEEDVQVVFLDTPGIFKPKVALDKYMVSNAIGAISDVEVILFVIDATKGFGEKEAHVWHYLEEFKNKVILVINKIDLLKNKNSVLDLIKELSEKTGVEHIVPVSVLRNKNMDELKKTLISFLPEGPAYYPDDMLTDKDLRYIIEELIRESLIHLLYEELPYSIAVLVEEIDGKYVSATIICERESQKGILIGKRGEMIKKIGQDARNKIEQLLGKKIFLELRVKVIKNWRKDEKTLKKLGYYSE